MIIGQKMEKLDTGEDELIKNYRQLNETGKEKLSEISGYLQKINEISKEEYPYGQIL